MNHANLVSVLSEVSWESQLIPITVLFSFTVWSQKFLELKSGQIETSDIVDAITYSVKKSNINENICVFVILWI